MKGKLRGIEAREPFDAMMERAAFFIKELQSQAAAKLRLTASVSTSSLTN